MFRNSSCFKKEIKDIVTIIAPRHINRSLEIKKLSESFNLGTQILKDELISDNKEVIIINSFEFYQIFTNLLKVYLLENQ